MGASGSKDGGLDGVSSSVDDLLMHFNQKLAEDLLEPVDQRFLRSVEIESLQCQASCLAENTTRLEAMTCTDACKAKHQALESTMQQSLTPFLRDLQDRIQECQGSVEAKAGHTGSEEDREKDLAKCLRPVIADKVAGIAAARVSVVQALEAQQ